MTTERKFDVFGVGNAIVDTLVMVDDDFIREHDLQKGGMTLVDSEKQAHLLHALRHHSLELRSGGSAANTMIGLAKCGGTGFYSGKVSRDPNGIFYREDLLEAGIRFDVHPRPEEGLPTGTCVVLTTPDAERTMYTHLGVSSELSAKDIDVNLLKQCQYAYLEGYLLTGEHTKSAALETMKQCKHQGIPVGFSFSDPWLVGAFQAEFRRLTAEYVDIAFCNADEAREFAGDKDLHQAATLIGAQVNLAFITNGAKGALVVQEGKVQEVPGFQVKAIDTNGAGDNFAAGVLYALTHGRTALEAARWGNYLASLVVQVIGARIDKDVKEDYETLMN